jgi:hypothetical protein
MDGLLLGSGEQDGGSLPFGGSTNSFVLASMERQQGIQRLKCLACWSSRSLL